MSLLSFVANQEDMCEKDGGVTVYEKVSISREQHDKLPKVNGSTSIRAEDVAKPEDPIFSVDKEIVLKEWAPRVIRWERSVKRRVDRKTIGDIVTYARVGGDFPTGIGHPTSFSCPEHKQLYADQEKLFAVEGKTK